MNSLQHLQTSGREFNMYKGNWQEWGKRMTASRLAVSLGVMKMFGIDCGDGCTSLNTLKITEL